MTANLDNTGSGALTLPSLLVRGLPVSYALSGLRSLRGSQPVDLVFVDRIEVSKGPGGVLGGVADFRGRGGVVLSTSNTAHLKLQWALLARWRMTLAGMAEELTADQRRHQPFTAALQRTSHTWNGALQWSLDGELDTGPLRHKLLLGMDLGRSRSVTRGIDLGDLAGTASLDVTEHKQALVLQDQVQAGPVRLRVSVQRARTPQHDETLRFAPGSGNGSVDAFRAEPLRATNWDAGVLYPLHRPCLHTPARRSAWSRTCGPPERPWSTGPARRLPCCARCNWG